MGPSRDRAPDPTRSLNEAQPPLPTRPRLQPIASPAPPPPGRQPKRDLAHNQLTVRDGKVCPERITLLSEAIKGSLANHLERVKRLHRRDLAEGHGRMELPSALARNYPNTPARIS